MRLLIFVWICFSEIYDTLLLQETPELILAFLNECKDNWDEKVRTNMCYLSFSTCSTQLQLSIQSEIIQTFCTTRNYQHFCAPNLAVTKFPIILFSPSSPMKTKFLFFRQLWQCVALCGAWKLRLCFGMGRMPSLFYVVAVSGFISQKLGGLGQALCKDTPPNRVTGMWAGFLWVAGTAGLVWK